MSEIIVISETRDQVGECPVWSVAEQALYWVDIEGCLIRRLDWASRTQLSWRLPERVGCIALSAHGGVVAAMETGVFAVQLMANVSDFAAPQNKEDNHLHELDLG